jgi:hypothetical protein
MEVASQLDVPLVKIRLAVNSEFTVRGQLPVICENG